MLKYFILLVFIIAVGLFSLVVSLDVRLIFQKAKAGIEKDKQMFYKGVESLKNTGLSKHIDGIENRILTSNIKMYFPYYGFGLHFIISLVVSWFFFQWISEYMNVFVSLFFSLLGFFLPNVILQLTADVMNYRIRKHTVDFLNILKNHLIATGDLFKAFEIAKDYSIEPLKTYLDIMVYERKHKIPTIKCINNFIDKIQNQELILFMENLKICEIHDGDKLALIDEFANEISSLNDDSDKDDAEDQILKMGLYALLILNFVVMGFILNSKYSLEITGTLYGNAVFVLDCLISFYIIYMSLDKVN